MNSGPSIPWLPRYSQIAWLMASTCHSLKVRCNEEPRWPEVPKTTRCAATEGSGRRSAYALSSAPTSMSDSAGAGLPASGLILVLMQGFRPQALLQPRRSPPRYARPSALHHVVAAAAEEAEQADDDEVDGDDVVEQPWDQQNQHAGNQGHQWAKGE